MNGYYAKDNNSWNVPVITYDDLLTVTVTAKGSYYFANSGSTFTSNNAGYNNSSATTTLSVYVPTNVTISWGVSSESSYDKFTCVVDGTTQVSGASGSNSSSFTLSSGTHTIQLTYSKDSSAASGSDSAWITFGSSFVLSDSASGGSSGGGNTGGGTTDTRASCPVTGCYGRLDSSDYGGYRCDTCGQYTTYCSVCGDLAYPDGAGL